MLKRTKNIKIVISLVLALALMLSIMAQSAFALNYQGNKAINIQGYQYVDTTHVKVFFDKNCSTYVHKEQFKIQTEDGQTTIPISTATGATGGGWNNQYAPTGTTATITTQNALSYNTRYKLTVSSTLLANNNLTLGSYFKRSDISFYFKTPDTDNTTYQGNPQLTFLQSEAGAGAPEENVVVFVDMPMSDSQIDTIKSGMHIYKNTGATPWPEVIQDDYVNTGTHTSGAGVYAVQVNDAHTTLFFPMTLGGSSSTSYDFDTNPAREYRVETPTITAINNNTVAGTSQTFTTTSVDIPDKPSGLQVTGHTSSSISIQWNDPASNVADHYNVYYCQDQYFRPDVSTVNLSGDTITKSSGVNYCTVSIPSSGTWYIRVVPVNSSNEMGGYTVDVSQTI